MIFKFLKKQITLDVFTYRKEVLEYFTLDRTNKLIPEWYKKTPISDNSYFYPSSTLKGCYGIRELFNKGFSIPLWSDLAINIKKQEKLVEYRFADGQSSIEFHNIDQWKKYASPEENIHFKIISPWRIKEKKGTQFLAMEFIWHKPIYDFKISTGVVNFKQNHATHINGFFSIKHDSHFVLPAGRPLFQYIPLSEKKVNLKYHLIDEKEFHQIGTQVKSFFTNSIVKLKKCPFKNYTKKI